MRNRVFYWWSGQQIYEDCCDALQYIALNTILIFSPVHWCKYSPLRHGYRDFTPYCTILYTIAMNYTFHLTMLSQIFTSLWLCWVQQELEYRMSRCLRRKDATNDDCDDAGGDNMWCRRSQHAIKTWKGKRSKERHKYQKLRLIDIFRLTGSARRYSIASTPVLVQLIRSRSHRTTPALSVVLRPHALDCLSANLRFCLYSHPQVKSATILIRVPSLTVFQKHFFLLGYKSKATSRIRATVHPI
jgi:hypothetical protein